MKLIDVTFKGNVCRFYLGTDWLKKWSGDNWNKIPYEPEKIHPVNKEYVTTSFDIYFPYDIEIIPNLSLTDVSKNYYVLNKLPNIYITNYGDFLDQPIWIGMSLTELKQVIKRAQGKKSHQYHYSQPKTPRQLAGRRSWYQRLKENPEKFAAYQEYQRYWQRRRREEQKRQKMNQRRKEYVSGIRN